MCSADPNSEAMPDIASCPSLWNVATLSVFIQRKVDGNDKTATAGVGWLVCGPWALKLTRDVHVRRHGRSYVLSNAIGTSEFYSYPDVAADVADLLEQQVPTTSVVTNIVVTLAANVSKAAIVYLDRLLARYSAVQVRCLTPRHAHHAIATGSSLIIAQ